jgi:hypothetical protein
LPLHVAAPALSSLVASADGLGPIKLKQPISLTDVRGLIRFEPIDCVGDIRGDGFPIAKGDLDAGGWEPNYPAVHEPFGGVGPFSVTVFTQTVAGKPINTKTSEVAEISVWDKAIRTQAGVGIGSTLPELQSAYPSLLDAVHGEESDVYVVPGTPGDIWFEIENSDSVYWIKDTEGQVLWMTLVPHGSEPAALAGTSGAAYACPVE